MNTPVAIQMKIRPTEHGTRRQAAIGRMRPKRLLALAGAVSLALVEVGHGQTHRGLNARGFKLGDGLADSACLSATVSLQGKVLVRHPGTAGVSEFDGYSIQIIPSPGEGIGRVYGSPAGQLWTVARQGLQEFKDGSWLLHPVPEIAAQFRASLPWALDPVPLCPIKQGQVLLLLPDRLLEFNSETPDKPQTRVLRLAGNTGLERFSSMVLARDGGLWVTGARGVIRIPGPIRNVKADTSCPEYLPPEGLPIRNFQEPQEDSEGGLIVLADSVTNRSRLLMQLSGGTWTTLATGPEKIRQGWRSEDRTYYSTSINSLSEYVAGQWEPIESEEIAARQYFDVAVEPSGVFWVATSEGLLRFAPLVWRTPRSARSISSQVSCLTPDESGRLWFVSSNALHVLQEERHGEYALPPALGDEAQGVQALFPLRDGTVVLEAESGAYEFKPTQGTFRPLVPAGGGRQCLALALLKDGNLVVQSFGPGPSPPGSRLDLYDGTRLAPFLELPTDPMLGTNMFALCKAQNGDVWLSSEHGVACYRDKKWRTFVSTDRSTPELARWFAEPADGKIWCANSERIWEFDGKNWLVVRSGFDRINGLTRARDGSMWVPSNNGLYRWSQATWVENGREEGLTSTAIRAVCEDGRGRIWAGTGHGLSLYHPEADPDPPRTYIQELTAKETNIPEGATITLAFNGQDKWNYTRRARLLFSHRLDAREWSAFEPANNIAFIDLPAGKHYFDVRAMDRNGNIDPNPARLEFAVILPWYKESRLVMIALAGMAIALFFAGLAYNRHRQLVRSYAEVEKKVADRTRELEIATRALVQSQKMNALGTLAAGIAHDFNNILSIIKGSAQLIEENLENPHKVRTRVDRIKTVVEQGTGIVKAMLGFTRESGQQPTPCAINEVVAETLKLLGDRFLHEVQISFEPAADLPVLNCPKDFIQQIVLNFVLNAADSMGKDKRVIITTSLLNKAPEDLVLAPAPAAGYICIAVRDFGCGIPSENLPRIFEPFFTTKALSTRRGTGLGLSMVYELAKKLEAGLTVESVVEQGSVFRLLLPIKNASSQ
jgi:signal transduction histidine kinase/ligand-binding sensor domain-containing protein